MTITIKEAAKKDRAVFWRLPGRLHGQYFADWLEPRDLFGSLSEKARLLLAFDGEEPVARIAVDVSAVLSGADKEACALFWLFEAKDAFAGKAILSAAEDSAKEMGAGKLIGPLHPRGGEQGMGIVVGGFSHKPAVFGVENPAWYGECLTESGYSKYEDYLSFLLDFAQAPLDRVKKASEWSKNKFGLKAAPMNLIGYKKEVRDILLVLRGALPAETPLDEKRIRTAAKEMRYLLDPDLSCIVRNADGAPVACIAGLPDYNQILPMTEGRLSLFRIREFLRAKKKIDGCRIFLQYCAAGAQNGGAILVGYEKIAETAVKKYAWAELSQISEHAKQSAGLCRAIGAKECRRIRIFAKVL